MNTPKSEENTPLTITINADTQDAMQKLSELETSAQAFGSAMTNALKSSIIEGKDFSSVLKDVAISLSNTALSSALKPIEQNFSNIFSSLLGNILPFANGGVPGKITPFAQGGIVSNPTFFPMSGSGQNNIGLMGEAGSEAILPLARGADGALGVAMSGSANSQPININFNVTTPNAEGFARSEAQITSMLARAVGRGRRGL